MKLRNTIKKILREQADDFNTIIKDYEDGFDVIIMNGDKKIGEISFAKENMPNLYTIVDATIDDEYKGNRTYPKTIINLFKERPNLIINSVFRSPEAEKSWRYLLSNLPSNIGKSFKYYKDEDTTLYQLKLKKGLNESDDKLKKDIETPNFIRRRLNIRWLNKQLHYALETAADKYIEEKDKLLNMNVDKFASLVAAYLMVEVCVRHYEMCTMSSGNYDLVWNFVKEYYYPEIVKKYYDIQYED